MAIVTTDVVMMGWLGPEALAAGSLAGHFYGFFDYVALGLLGAIAPILAQHLGARQFRMVRPTVRQGFWAAVIVAVPCIAIIWQAQAILVLFGQNPDLAGAGQSYLRFMVLGFIPGLWYLVLSEFLAAHVRPRAALVVTTLGIAINGLADYALMFGHFGLPRLELVGAGIASAAVNIVMFLGLLCFALRDRRLRRYRLLGRFWRADWPRFFEIIRLGLPIAVIAMAEFGMFLASALLMGLLGTSPLAAHAIALQCVAVGGAGRARRGSRKPPGRGPRGLGRHGGQFRAGGPAGTTFLVLGRRSRGSVPGWGAARQQGHHRACGIAAGRRRPVPVRRCHPGHGPGRHGCPMTRLETA